MIKLTPTEARYLYDHYRDEISYEANLIVQRTGWFITSQAFLFSCLVLGIPKESIDYTLGHSLYFPLIPLLASIICILTCLSIKAALDHASIARNKLDALCQPEGKDYHHIFQRLHTVQKRSKKTIARGVGPAAAMPLIFLYTWAFIIISESHLWRHLCIIINIQA